MYQKQSYLRKYHLEHVSDLHLRIRTYLSDAAISFEEVIFLEDHKLDFIVPSHNVAIILLESKHDHTDSYHLEAELKSFATKKGFETIFVDESIEASQLMARIKVK